MDKSLFKKITVTIISVLIFSYVVYLFLGSNKSDVVTEYAKTMSVTDSISSKGFIIRDETYVKNTSSGIVSYNLEDGEKVSVNGIVATIYKNESDAINQKKIESIQNDIEKFNELNKTAVTVTAGIDTIDNQLNDKLVNLLSSVNQHSFTDLNSNSDDLLFMINERQIVTGQIKNFDSKIDELKKEKESLQSSSSENIGVLKAQKAGYFVSSIDGYESCYDYNKVTQITAEELEKIKKSASTPKDAVGKIYSGLNWYIVCPVSAQEALNLSLFSENVTIDLPFASSESIPAKIVAINQKTKKSDGVVVLQCNYMSDSLSNIREENVSISMGNYKGIRVNKKALHDDYVTYEITDANGKTTTQKKKVQGIYVLYGNQVIFKQVSVIYSGSDYVICDTNPEEGIILNGETVAEYDQIIVEGRDLYDGKVIK